MEWRDRAARKVINWELDVGLVRGGRDSKEVSLLLRHRRSCGLKPEARRHPYGASFGGFCFVNPSCGGFFAACGSSRRRYCESCRLKKKALALRCRNRACDEVGGSSSYIGE
eukprot:12887829-Prorocentrum_lima.AAC.1